MVVADLLWYDWVVRCTYGYMHIGREMLLPDATLVSAETVVESFTEWAREAEPRLRHALTASFGSQLGQEATADALAYAWERWDRVSVKDNPLGYVYGIGRNRARRMIWQRRPVFVDVRPQRFPHVEPGLPAAMARLSEKQRIVVILVYCHEWSLSEVAELLGTQKTTVQNHAERGLARLRTNLGVEL
jgi:DNA-directed RNA polymerase specialized sigma24 family protein